MIVKKPNNQTVNYKIIEEKILNLQQIIRNTILSCQKYKLMDILGANEINICMQSLETLFTELNNLLQPIQENADINHNNFLNTLQTITSELSSIIKTFGTLYIDDLITVCLGSDFTDKYIKSEFEEKYKLISKYTHPINYRVLPWKKNEGIDNEFNKGASASSTGSTSKNIINKNISKAAKENIIIKSKSPAKNKTNILQKNKIIEDCAIVEYSNTLDCFDLARTSKNFQTRVYGIKISIQDQIHKQTMIIYCVTDDILLDCLNYPFVINKLYLLKTEKPNDPDFTTEAWERFLLSLTLKEILIYEIGEIFEKFIGYLNQTHLIKQKTINQVVKEFIGGELYNQRLTLIQLLLKSYENEYQYLAYLLYDLLSNDNNNSIDTQEQTLLFDSLPWNIKKNFRDAMKQTIEYTNNLANFDNNKIPLEQQICLLKASDNVKEKAMQKLKEVKSKSDDSGSKARQYLDGLLKIPFGIYKEEAILTKIQDIHGQFIKLISSINEPINFNIMPKDKYTNIEIQNALIELKGESGHQINEKICNYCKDKLTNHTYRQELISNSHFVNILIKKYKIKKKICLSGRNINNIKEQIVHFVEANKENSDLFNEIIQKFNFSKENNNNFSKENNNNFSKENNNNFSKENNNNFSKDNYNILNNLSEHIEEIKDSQDEINKYMCNVSNILDDAIHGHTKAKRQIERIIGQWINGEKTGYCFGFEGPMGLGKTTIAKKGIANCLLDEDGTSRPFSFIAIGGSSNGSILDGHSYTYVGSTWGKIVDILIDQKCMNPIIFIDELDKVSRTEHGKEIIGILTHLIDATQNDSFQDKYFTGIDLDLSKVLFIFSYNDPEAIDKILLDRIHRVKFDHLTLDDKLVIANKYLLPEIYKKMGLENTIKIDDEVIKFIINKYTCESGVRKLKELLFEIIAEINLSILKSQDTFELPIVIDIDTVKDKYLKERHEMNYVCVNPSPQVGVINGLWANSLGKGGILHIESNFYATSNYLELKLTGMQGDVMKESMAVAKTLAWSLLKKDRAKKLNKDFKDSKMQGIHIHVPEGATPKDGPSAGTAITVSLYSLLTNRKINNKIAMTGEMCLQGNVTAIGGLDLKILGGLLAGVSCFIFPKQNHKDFILFMEKYEGKDIIDGVEFIEVEHINDVLERVFID